ncbi:hypothetical protein EDB87DRAFT_1579251 [Lactarius vividus]|nr:hypothetical protein EDB87DRAFT_1579251 [Lactarius vividus]
MAVFIRYARTNRYNLETNMRRARSLRGALEVGAWCMEKDDPIKTLSGICFFEVDRDEYGHDADAMSQSKESDIACQTFFPETGGNELDSGRSRQLMGMSHSKVQPSQRVPRLRVKRRHGTGKQHRKLLRRTDSDSTTSAAFDGAQISADKHTYCIRMRWAACTIKPLASAILRVMREGTEHTWQLSREGNCARNMTQNMFRSLDIRVTESEVVKSGSEKKEYGGPD